MAKVKVLTIIYADNDPTNYCVAHYSHKMNPRYTLAEQLPPVPLDAEDVVDTLNVTPNKLSDELLPRFLGR